MPSARDRDVMAWAFTGVLLVILIAVIAYWMVNVVHAADRCRDAGGQWVRHTGGGVCVQPFYPQETL